MRKYLAVLGIVVTVAAGGVLAAQSAPLTHSLASFLPNSGQIRVWQVIPDTDRGGSTDEVLYTIYDGAVPQMRNKGLQAAHQRIYKKGNQRISVDIFQMGNWQQAKAYFLPHRETQRDGAESFTLYNTIKQQAFVAAAAGSITGMFWQRNYVCTVGMQGSGVTDQARAKTFLIFASNKIKKRYQK